jgi:rhodanese-related sulfurtransferase
MCASVDLRPSLRPACELAALAAILAAAAWLWQNTSRPAPTPAPSSATTPASATTPYSVNVSETRADPRFQNTLWVDARAPAAFAAGHVPGALRLTEPEWEQLLPAVLDRWSPGGVIVVYCDTSTCQTSERIAARLRRELAADSVYALTGGWEALRSAP